MGGVGDFRVKLHAIEAATLIAHGCEWNGLGYRGCDEALGQRIHTITVTHPHIKHGTPVRVAAILNMIEQAGLAGHCDFRVAELPFARGRDPAAKLLRHGLHAVADAENGRAERKDSRRRPGRVRVRHGLRAARQDHAARLERAHLIVGDVPRMYLAIHPQLAHAAGDELSVLRPEIEDQDAVRVDVRVRGGRGRWTCNTHHQEAR